MLALGYNEYGTGVFLTLYSPQLTPPSVSHTGRGLGSLDYEENRAALRTKT